MTDCGIRKASRSISWCTKSAFGLGIGIMLATLGVLGFPHSIDAQAANAVVLSLGPILTQYGTPATNAPVRVCLLTSIGIPCPTTGVTLYSDYNLTQQITNPTTLNTQGILNVFTTEGDYLIQVTPVATQPQNIYTFYHIAGSSNGITALTEDVTATGPGSAVATVVAIPPHVTLTGTPSTGSVPTATGSNTATWQGPASSIANCFFPVSNGSSFSQSVVDQGCTLTNLLNVGGGYGINLPTGSAGITNYGPTIHPGSGTASATRIVTSSASSYQSQGFNGGLVLTVTSIGSGYVSAIRISCTISGGTFTVPATCVAAGNTLNSTLVVEIVNPGVYTSAAGASISVSGGTGSGWSGTLALSGGVPQGDNWGIDAAYNFNGLTTSNTAGSIYTIEYSGHQSSAGTPAVQFLNSPIQGVASGWYFNLDNFNNAFATYSEANLTANRTYAWPDVSGGILVFEAIVAASNCGSLSGSTGCYEVDDGTGPHYIPKW